MKRNKTLAFVFVIAIVLCFIGTAGQGHFEQKGQAEEQTKPVQENWGFDVCDEVKKNR